MNISCILLHSYGNKIEHYRIRKTDDGKLTVDDEVFFGSLFEFVEVRRVFILRCIVISVPVHYCIVLYCIHLYLLDKFALTEIFRLVSLRGKVFFCIFC